MGLAALYGVASPADRSPGCNSSRGGAAASLRPRDARIVSVPSQRSSRARCVKMGARAFGRQSHALDRRPDVTGIGVQKIVQLANCWLGMVGTYLTHLQVAGH
jgi:hypothetical protein